MLRVIEAEAWAPYLSANTTNTAYKLAAGGYNKQDTLASAGLPAIPLDSDRGVGFWTGIEIIPFGTSADNQTFSINVYGASDTREGGSITDSLVVIAATLGQAPGIAGTMVNASQLFAKSLTVTVSGDATTPVGTGTAIKAAYGHANTTTSAFNPGAALATAIARAFIPHCGVCNNLYLDFDMTGAASGNVLYRRVRHVS